MQLTNSEIKVLQILSRGRKRYNEIAEQIEMSPGGLTKLLKRLQDKGLIKRIQESTSYPPPVYYELTEEGKKALKLADFTTLLFSPVMSEEDKKAVEELIDKLKKKYGL